MKHYLIVYLGCLLILSARLSFSQISTNGVVDINPYAELQPDLIEGISALPAMGDPVIRHVYFIDRHILAVTIDERAIIYANLKPYIKKEGERNDYLEKGSTDSEQGHQDARKKDGKTDCDG